jgi:hypothetical protein
MPWALLPTVLALLMTAAASLCARAQQASLSAALIAERPEVFVHEPFELQIVITSSGVRLDQNFNMSGLPDAQVLQCGTFGELPVQNERRGGQVFEVRRFKCTATPMAAQTLRLAPTLRVALLSRAAGFFGPRWMATPQDVPVQPLTLTVKALPAAGRPANFSGAVGQFALDVTVTPTNVAVGDLVTVSTTVRGSGYLEAILPPSLSAGRALKVYDPKAVPSAATTERRFEQTVVPQSTNATAVPLVTFVFFDPRQAAYVTAARGPFPLVFHERTALVVEPYKPTAATNAPAALRRPGVGSIDRSQTLIMCAVTYWLCAGLAGTYLYRRVKRKRLMLMVFPLLALAVFVPLWLGVRMAMDREANTAMARTETARFAPTETSARCFDAQRGAAVRIVEFHGRWYRIAAGENSGWVPADAVKTRRSGEATLR